MTKIRYLSGKTYTHAIGLSCAFRQWRAESHCRFIHGYSLQIEFTFSTEELDHRNWAVDFGGLKPLKGMLEDAFDHRLVVAKDDPLLEQLQQLEVNGGCRLTILPHVGCEKYAEMIFEVTEQWLKDAGFNHVQLEKVIVREHEANWAGVERIGDDDG